MMLSYADFLKDKKEWVTKQFLKGEGKRFYMAT